MTRIPPFFAGYQARVESELRRLSSDTGDRVERAIAYTLHAPSKRVRAVLTMLAAELCGGAAACAAVTASAIEMVHAASLISRRSAIDG